MKKTLGLSLRTILTFALVLLANIGNMEAQKVWHVVRRGDNPEIIARIYNTTPSELMRLNPNVGLKLQPGDTVVLPLLNVFTLSRYHTVCRGETAFSLAQRYGLSLQNLLDANPNVETSHLLDGTVLCIPRADKETAASAQAESAREGMPEHMRTYKVAEGETFYGIARQYGLTMEQLAAANRRVAASNYTIKTGDNINIPTPGFRAADEPGSTSTKPSAARNANKPLKHMRVCVSLPFDTSDNAIKSLCLNYYRGFLEAANKLKAQGLSMDVYAFSSGLNATQADAAFRKNVTDGCDLLIGPYYQNQLSVFEHFSDRQSALWLVPFDYGGSSVFQNHRLFVAQAPSSYFYSDQCDLLVEKFKSHRIIIVDAPKQNELSLPKTLKQRIETGSLAAGTIDYPFNESTLLKAIDRKKKQLVGL